MSANLLILPDKSTGRIKGAMLVGGVVFKEFYLLNKDGSFSRAARKCASVYCAKTRSKFTSVGRIWYDNAFYDRSCLVPLCNTCEILDRRVVVFKDLAKKIVVSYPSGIVHKPYIFIDKTIS